MMRARQDSGFTLIEVLVAVTLSMLVFGATLTVLEVFQRDTGINQLRNETQDNARNAIDRLARQLRSVAAPSEKTPGALEVAEPYAITFQTVDSSQVSAENPSNNMRVRYCLDNSNPSNEVLWQQIKRWGKKEAPVPSTTACPDPKGGDFERSSQLVQHISNGLTTRPLFEYGPPSATLVSQITSVQVNLYLDPKPGTRPGETQLTSAIALRNANRRPTASFTATQLGSGRHILLNASESVDPDGLALTYKWWDNSTLLPTTAQQYETGQLTQGSSHTFKLEVTDPGGLFNATEQTVTIQ